MCFSSPSIDKNRSPRFGMISRKMINSYLNICSMYVMWCYNLMCIYIVYISIWWYMDIVLPQFPFQSLFKHPNTQVSLLTIWSWSSEPLRFSFCMNAATAFVSIRSEMGSSYHGDSCLLVGRIAPVMTLLHGHPWCLCWRMQVVDFELLESRISKLSMFI